MKLKWRLAFGLALFNDLIDLAGIGSIPVIGDILDIGTSALLWRVLGTRYTVPTFLELVPGLDVLPIYTVTVGSAYYQKERRSSQKGMKDIDVT